MNISERVKKFLNKAANRRGYRIERIVDFGQHQIDVFEILIEQIDPMSPDFFFIEVGANDGCSGDPVHESVKRYGWHGLLLEPQPDVFEKLTKNYRDQSQLILENAALGEQDGTMPFYTLEGSDYLATFDRNTLAKRSPDPSKIIEIPVQVMTFATLMQKHGIQRVDLLMVDTEGFDYQIIKMALKDGLPKPRLIRYEHLHLTTSSRNACVDLLVSNGYKLLRDERDTIAYRREGA